MNSPLIQHEQPAESHSRPGGSALLRLARRIWRRYDNSSLPVALKWSLSISALIVVAMAILGSYLIRQQEDGFRRQVDQFSGVIVSQLAGVAGEPMLAGDTLALQILLGRQIRDALILGAELFDADGQLLVRVGVTPPDGLVSKAAAAASTSTDWENDEYQALAYTSPVLFDDVKVGYLVLSIDRGPLEADLRRTTGFLLLSTLAMILVAGALAVILAHRMSRPIERLARAGVVLTGPVPTVIGDHGRKDEIGQVLATFERLAEDVRRKDVVEAAFSRYVSPTVARKVLDTGVDNSLGGSSVEGSVLFCDVVAFTEISESLTPGEVGSLLNDYFRYFALAAESCSGHVDKFIGDCVMILFGIPQGDPYHALHAMTCGMLIQRLTERVNRQRTAEGLPTVEMRVGISSGPMLAGNVGSEDRMQYTVVGDTVNVASRLCALAQPGGILITATSTEDAAPGGLQYYRRLEPVSLRGRRQPVDVVEMDTVAVAIDTHAEETIEHIIATVATRK